MNSSRTMIVVGKIYDNVECALWAALLSFTIYFVTCVVPGLPENARRAEIARTLKVADEDRSYCEKWGIGPGTEQHARCTMDLRELRKKIERELADEASIL